MTSDLTSLPGRVRHTDKKTPHEGQAHTGPEMMR